ncbi:MAG: regulatory protein GemA [Rhodospirillaceae bacterium]|nr:regulatory protein GemA [Rhodospirillaceae bacterium]
MIAHGKLAVIHIAKRQLGLDDPSYRALLHDSAGVDSAGELDDDGFDHVMDAMAARGFVSAPPAHVVGHVPPLASGAQIGKIRHLWSDFTDGTGDDRGLSTWLQHKFQVASPRRIPADKAQKVIGALATMVAKRAGSREAAGRRLRGSRPKGRSRGQ